jgi:hypothetical protein
MRGQGEDETSEPRPPLRKLKFYAWYSLGGVVWRLGDARSIFLKQYGWRAVGVVKWNDRKWEGLEEEGKVERLEPMK